MKSLFVITIKLYPLTDVPNQMTVSGAFVYVCENPFKWNSIRLQEGEIGT